jgi:hypothetical protein
METKENQTTILQEEISFNLGKAFFWTCGIVTFFRKYAGRVNS